MELLESDSRKLLIPSFKADQSTITILEYEIGPIFEFLVAAFWKLVVAIGIYITLLFLAASGARAGFLDVVVDQIRNKDPSVIEMFRTGLADIAELSISLFQFATGTIGLEDSIVLVFVLSIPGLLLLSIVGNLVRASEEAHRLALQLMYREDSLLLDKELVPLFILMLFYGVILFII
jgi:hypothetical protein